MPRPRFTIFTPTYNRAGLLGRVHQCLCAQTLRDFEWLIVDDGSTDGTSEQVRAWQSVAPFAITYIFQHNQGKHHAYNKALEQAGGEFFAVLDSDDTLVPAALERMAFHWEQIPEQERPHYSGVACLCVDEQSQIVGRPYPRAVLDCHPHELWTKYGATAERWGMHATAVLRQYPFPELPGEPYCPEGLIWNRIGRRFLMRHVNEALRVYHTECSGVTPWIRSLLMRSPRYASLYFQECLSLDSPIPSRLKSAVSYIRYSLHAGVPVRNAVSQVPSPLLAGLSVLSGAAFYQMDRFFLSNRRTAKGVAK